MSLVRYNHWNLFDQLNKELSNPVATFRKYAEDNTANANWAPTVDITEDENSFKLFADIPGVDPKDIEVSMENGVLTINGERKSKTTAEKETYRRVERHYGMFYRRFDLPDTADAEKIDAHAENGVLKVTIPKKEVAQARRIEVKH